MPSPKPKLVEILTADHLLLPGLLFEPETHSKKALIVLHGTGSSSILRHQPTTLEFAQHLNQQDVAYLVFNNRGAGIITKFDTVTNGIRDSQYFGMSYELISECILDIDAAIDHLKQLGYTEISLLGFSTGANKICVYNYYKPSNFITSYILACGGDDTGLYYSDWGEEKFNRLLLEAQGKIAAGKGRELVGELVIQNHIISYQSLLDIIDPDGNYNIFPY